MTDQQPYVLGTGVDEFERLGLQARLWADAAVSAWRRAGIRPGQRALDVGCGPGFAAFDLAQLVTSSGEVVAIDESEPFLEHVEAQRITRGLPWLRARRGDVQDLDGALAGEAPFDLAYARWLLCFVGDPEAVVNGVARALRPGGALIVHDYFNYASMRLAPPSPSHQEAVAATVEAWNARGGDPDVVGRLPALLDRAGFELTHLVCHQRVARGTDSMFAWIDTWWHTFAPKLVELGRLSSETCATLLAELAERRGDALAFAHCPPVYEVIAVRR
ncbi:MAG: methyltransferase domain-containing protein [Planctomycetes bacterium]|nr:methyltransferase domain-containing protein [Planctomycetota bacterium]